MQASQLELNEGNTTELLLSIQRFHESMLEEKVFENESVRSSQSSLYNVKEELIKDAIRTEILQYVQDLEEGYRLLVQEAVEQQKKGSVTESELQNLFLFSNANTSIFDIKNTDKCIEMIQNGVPLYSVVGMSSDTVYEIYAIIVRVINTDPVRAKEALLLSRLLLTLVPYVAEFWNLYAIALFHNGLFEHVIIACEQALRFDPNLYDAALLLIRALRDVGRRGEAEARLGSFMESAQRRSDEDAIVLFTQAQYQLGKQY